VVVVVVEIFVAIAG